MKCKTCAYWDQSPLDECPDGMGLCEAITADSSGARVIPPEYHSATLCTDPEFGCKKWTIEEPQA